MRALPPEPTGRQSAEEPGALRGTAAGDRARNEIRTASLGGRSAVGPRPGRDGGRTGRCRLCRAGSPSLDASLDPRLQPGGRLGEGTRPAGRAWSGQGSADGEPDHALVRPTSRQREGRLCGAARAGAAHPAREDGGPGRRCVHDGCHARGVRAGARRSGCARGSRGYGSASRARTALSTTASTVSMDASPSTLTQQGSAANRA